MQKVKKISILILCCLSSLMATAQSAGSISSPQRIISLNGAISEILCALGLEQQIVGVDVTSSYPAALQQKPKVGHNRNISAEGVLAVNPTLVLGLQSQLTPQLQAQLRTAGVKTVLLEQQFSFQGVRDMVKKVAAEVGATQKAKRVLANYNQAVAALNESPLQKKVLFIYARGAGTMLVSGTGTSVDKVIALAGARNAVTAFSDFKPLSAESLVGADPDVILMFDHGLQSMGGVDGLLKVPGVAQTSAGKNKKIITMDGELLAGFTLRLPQAISELHHKIAAE